MKKLTAFLVAIILSVSVFGVVLPAEAVEEPFLEIYGIYLEGNNKTENIKSKSFSTGDCSLLHSGDEWLLIDAGYGNHENVDDTGLDSTAGTELANKLKSMGIEKISFYLSHVHNDHYGGCKQLLNNGIEIENVYLPDNSVDGAYEYAEGNKKKVIKWLSYDESKVTYLKVGDTFAFGSANATVLGPVSDIKFPVGDDPETDPVYKDAISSYINNRSLVTSFSFGEYRYLTAGDIEDYEEKALVKKYKNDELRANVFKLSHHALSTSNSAEFLAKVQPNYSYGCSVGYTYLTSTGKNRVTYLSRENASQYGIPFLIGDERDNFAAKITEKGITLYRGKVDDKHILSGWVKLCGGNGTTDPYDYYYISNGKILTGIQTIDSKVYLLSSGGKRETGKYTDGVYNPIRKFDSGKRAFASNSSGGYMYTGFHTINGYKYYFSKSDGYMAVGDNSWKLVTIDNKNYAINNNGVIYSKTKNCCYTGWLKYGAEYRYFDADGVMKTGFIEVNGKKYYLDKMMGFRKVGFQKIGKKYYYFEETNKAGYMVKSKFKKFPYGTRYFDSDGYMKTGFATINGYKYYFDLKTGYRMTGDVKIGKKRYFFSSSGKMYKDGWKKYGINYRYYDKKTGVMFSGWKTIKGKKYYFNKVNGLREVGLETISGETYYFTEKNRAGYLYKKGWKKFGKKYRYFSKKNGKMYTGWKTIKGKKYYFDRRGFRTTGKLKIKGKVYKFSSSGILL